MIDTKKCPYCAEEIKVEAIKCRYCREYLLKNEELTTSHGIMSSTPVSNSRKKYEGIVLVLVVVVISLVCLAIMMGAAFEYKVYVNPSFVAFRCGLDIFLLIALLKRKNWARWILLVLYLCGGLLLLFIGGILLGVGDSGPGSLSSFGIVQIFVGSLCIVNAVILSLSSKVKIYCGKAIE